MIRKIIYAIAVGVALMPLCVCSFNSFGREESRPAVWLDITRSPEERVSALIDSMTLDEKIDLLSGYEDFYLHPCDRLHIPAFKMADGPLGLASWGLFGRGTAYLSALSLAASWNRDLGLTLGNAFAEDWRARGIHLLLAPGVNLYRSSKSGRNFEYFGEDPYLTSEMAMAFTDGVSQGGVMPVVKHFAGNDQEFDRYGVNTVADETTLREIYLLPFEKLIKKGGVKAIMSGYNLLNGEHCSENEWLDSLLRKEWGFNGIHMSDWGATHSTFEAAHRGLDLEMGSNYFFTRQALYPLIEAGFIPESLIDEKVGHIYGACVEAGFFDRPQKIDSLPLFSRQRCDVALQGAREGIILLKNDGMLPKSPGEVRKIAVIGSTANPSVISDRRYGNSGIVYGGGGSSKVNPWYIRTDLDGILANYPETEVYYCEGVSNRLSDAVFSGSRFIAPTGERGVRFSVIDASTGEVVSEKITDRISEQWYNPGKFDAPEAYRLQWAASIVPNRDDSIIILTRAQGAYRLLVDGETVIDATDSRSSHYGEYVIPVRKNLPITLLLEYDGRDITPSEMRLGYVYAGDIDYGEATAMAREADMVVCCVGHDGASELEGKDRSFGLPYGQDALVEAVVDANPNTVVVIHGGGGVDMSRWVDNVPAIIHALYPGMEGGMALGEIVSGKVNPSAKLPFSIERVWEESPAAGNYDEKRDTREVAYEEGIFMGYRGFDRNGIQPLFPFGHGLSYAEFRYGDLKVEKCEEGDNLYAVTFTVTNAGKREGAEVSQVYVSDHACPLPRPSKELKGFAKTRLNPGESKRVTILLDEEAFRHYDAELGDWAISPGLYKVKVGGSSVNLPLQADICVE